MGLFSSYRKSEAPEAHGSSPVTESTPVEPGPASTGTSRQPQKKDRPTPTRRQAEAARRERLHPTLTKKQARQENTRKNREARLAAMEARDSTPEKVLMRDLVDSRWNLGEFLLPAMVLMLALTFLQEVWRPMALVSIVAMYSFVALVILDLLWMWRRYKKLLAERHPEIDTKGRGLRMYGFNRSIQMRRLRMPKPTVQRGAKI